MKDSEKFKNWLNSLTVIEFPIARERIKKECKITSQVFAFWKSGRTKIPHLARPIIEKIAGRKIF